MELETERATNTNTPLEPGDFLLRKLAVKLPRGSASCLSCVPDSRTTRMICRPEVCDGDEATLYSNLPSAGWSWRPSDQRHLGSFEGDSICIYPTCAVSHTRGRPSTTRACCSAKLVVALQITDIPISYRRAAANEAIESSRIHYPHASPPLEFPSTPSPCPPRSSPPSPPPPPRRRSRPTPPYRPDSAMPRKRPHRNPP